MADDGMLMNFSIGDEPLQTKAVFRGGRWKDRLTAKKADQHREQKLRKASAVNHTNLAAGGEEKHADNAVPESERPAKRQKVDRPEENQSKPRAVPSSREVVSSLFSSNPSSKVAVEHNTAEDASVTEPSNAPLVDGLSTFTNLGLSTTLSAHLQTKLSLKAPTAIQKSAICQLLKEDSDAFIQAETGSGKTLAYLLPIVQRIMRLSSSASTKIPGAEKADSKTLIHRGSGLFALVLAPTRELCKQISVVLESLLRCANWIVAGTVIGGEKKKSEKARLRKGLNILVATPGRLVDHLENTDVLDVSNVRWLVLDEGDRLVELGFEDDIRKIVQELDQKSKIKKEKKEKENRTSVPGLPERRTTVLCSATMKMTTQRLGEISLRDAVHIKADPAEIVNDAKEDEKKSKDRAFLAPAQLKQSYIIVPPKQRLVTLAALLKRTFARRGSVMKAIVFFSCADSVDFHFDVFARKVKDDGIAQASDKNANDSDKENPAPSFIATVAQSNILVSKPNPTLSLHKLHGSLTQPVRTTTLSAFARSTDPSVLFCTDVASRGLDLPNIDLIIEYDPPFSSDDHLHRIGRTARAGRDGRAVIFLMPGSEEGYVDILKQGYRDGIGRGLIRNDVEEILKKGFGNVEAANAIDHSIASARDWSERAEEWQLNVERWVIDDKAQAGEVARKAFVSHVRAYATHVARERGIFDVKKLHLGHLAKAFALRDKPGNVGRGAGAEKGSARGGSQRERAPRAGDGGLGSQEKRQRGKPELPSTNGQDAASKMRAKMKEHMAGASEFNIG